MKKPLLVLGLISLVIGVAVISVGGVVYGCFNLFMASSCFYFYRQETDE